MFHIDALVIIDLQVASFVRGDKYDLPATLERINALATSVRAGGGRVIFVLHDGTPEQDLIPHTPGWQLLPELERVPADVIVRKTLNDAFAGTTLASELEAASVRTLAIAGWATDYCVDSTVRSAVSRGYQVLVPSDAHTVSHRAHLTAPQIIAHHNSIWAGLIASPPVRVAPTAELIAASVTARRL
ncbi:MAG: isochorismatase family protein [Myxococcota bacterium]